MRLRMVRVKSMRDGTDAPHGASLRDPDARDHL